MGFSRQAGGLLRSFLTGSRFYAGKLDKDSGHDCSHSGDLPFRSLHVPALVFHSITTESIKHLHRKPDNYDGYLDVTLDVRARRGNESLPPTLQRTPE
ncbi:MAG: hypothetical protein ABSC93_09205 [Bryobacteraceae bacterium]